MRCCSGSETDGTIVSLISSKWKFFKSPPLISCAMSMLLIKFSRQFLKYCLENFINSIDIAQDIKGGLLKNFHLEDIRETIVPSVSLPEQHRIVAKLEELLSELEKGKEQLHTALDQLK